MARAPQSIVYAHGHLPPSEHGNGPSALPNTACAACHKEIYERYRSTPMARASGPATDGFLLASFKHEASGVEYRIEKKDGHAFLSFSRPASANAVPGQDEELSGRRELLYFLGSGTRGRTFLFQQEGYWFEIPINWYAKKQIWDMAPNYARATEMPLTMPVDPGCLRCHASGAQPNLPGARNKYAAAPFTEGGITCTACHGPTQSAAAHIQSGGRVAMPKIGDLAPVHRDSVCLSCHLEGETAIVHQGKRMVDFAPGESIFDYASYFVRSSQAQAKDPGGARATSQWEALLESGCRRGAQEKLTCTSCHDPHASTAQMSATVRAEFYRARCLTCHDAGAGQSDKAEPSDRSNIQAVARPSQIQTDRQVQMQAESPGLTASFGASHHPENRDCVSCHMPRAASNDIAHEQVTDHRIPRIPEPASQKSKASLVGTLVAIGDGLGTTAPRPDANRDLGLAYAAAAVKGDRDSGERALTLLREAEKAPGSLDDLELHQQLGFLEQLHGDTDAAARQYRLALEADPQDSFAAGDLALLKAQAKQYAAAAELWARAFSEDPVQLKAGMNLAIIECGLGRQPDALGTLDRILAFSPDDQAAKKMRRAILSGQHPCEKRQQK